MPPDPELELRQASALVREQARIVERRENFLSGLPTDSDGFDVHSKQLQGERKILDDLKVIEAQKEKAVMEARGVTEVVSNPT